MCGVVGIVGTHEVNQRIYDALTVLQHRGQDAAGIVTAGDGMVSMRKGQGLVRDVFHQQHMLELRGNMGIGHVRYPTAGCDNASEAQPFYVNAPYGIVLGHNGNLTNAAELAQVLIREERRHLNTTSDSEVLLNVLASELQRVGTPRVTAADVFAAVTALYRRCRGGYAVVAMIIGHGVLGFRDPNGIRPAYYYHDDEIAVVTSERPAMQTAFNIPFEAIKEITPGHALIIRKSGKIGEYMIREPEERKSCSFERIYFSRGSDSEIYKERKQLGRNICERVLESIEYDTKNTVFSFIPNTAETAFYGMEIGRAHV